jgi:hypothetical protein
MPQWQLTIIRFENGSIAVTDDKGEQIPKLQKGELELAIPRICRWMRRKEHIALNQEREYWIAGAIGMLFVLFGTSFMLDFVYSPLMTAFSFVVSGMFWMAHLQLMVDLDGVK